MRLRQIATEYAGQAQFEWRAFLLRPEPSRSRNLEKFRAYTQSWLKPAGEPDSGDFQVWASDEGPPSHSVPPHLVAKAASRVGPEAFEQMHERLMRAYFSESRDISNWSTLETLWGELGLPEGGFEVAHAPEIAQQVIEEYREAREMGATGIPAVRLEGNSAVIVGAHAGALYRRWIDRTLERQGV